MSSKHQSDDNVPLKSTIRLFPSPPPPVAASPNFQLSTGYPQVGEEVIHNSPIWFHFASQIADVCKPFGYSDLT